MSARILLTIMCACACGFMLNQRFPFPQSSITELVRLTDPQLHMMLRGSWVIFLYTTPVWFLMGLFSLVHIFVGRGKGGGKGKLGPFPFFRGSPQLEVVLGERWHRRLPVPVSNPEWVTMGERGLNTGVMVIGAIGSFKTTGVMQPLAKQILSWQAQDSTKRIGGIVLEVKGDFCHQVKRVLNDAGRADDYVELGLTGEYLYNPLHNDQDAFAMAYGIATTITQLYGRGKDPFWPMAYTNLVKFVILLHKVVDEYVTLFQVYECIISPPALRKKFEEGKAKFSAVAKITSVGITPSVYVAHGDALSKFKWDTRTDGMWAEQTDELLAALDPLGVPYRIDLPKAVDSDMARRAGQFEAVQRWLLYDWYGIEPKLRAMVVEGISIFLSLFDDNMDLKRVFCPTKKEYLGGRALPPFKDLIESGKVLALNFPVAANPATARAIAVMLKADFQRAMLNRIPLMVEEPKRYWRSAAFIADEYQMLATVGASEPNGDEQFFALSRQSKCIPIVATQSISSLRSKLPGESWRDLMQTFRTKLFLATSDTFTADEASKACGKHQRWVPTQSISESAQDAHASVLSGQLHGGKSGFSTSHSRNRQWLPVFEPTVFMELGNAQCVALVYDGINPQPATRLYLKPAFLDVNVDYFQQVERKLL